MRNVLLITYHFPPVGGSGVQRAVKLARYLPASDWRVRVLTAADVRHPLTDSSLHRAVGESASIRRIRGWEPSACAARMCRPGRRERSASSRRDSIETRVYWRLDRWFNRLGLPEAELAWIPSAVRAARRMARRGGIDAVITTSPPAAVHLVGRAVQRGFGIPWIADLRDPLLGNFGIDPSSRWANAYFGRLERSIVRNAKRVVVTCDDLAGALRRRHGPQEPDRIVTIPNGFDPTDAPCRGHDEVRGDRRRYGGGPVVISHVGAFYSRQTIGPILDAMRRLTRGKQERSLALEFRVVGSVSARQKTLYRPGDETFLRETGYLPHDEAIREMSDADVLYLTVPPEPGGRLCIPAKTFEYLAFGRHIIATVHENSGLSRLLSRAGNVTLIHDWDPAAIATALAGCLDRWRRGALDAPRDRAFVEQFRRDRLGLRFAQLLDGCVAAPRGSDVPSTAAVAEEAA